MLSKKLKPVKQSAKQTSKKSSYVSLNVPTLNTECLLKIFSYLTISERIKVERVCKFWKEASQSGWVGFHTLHFQKSLWGISNKTKVTDQILWAVLLRCGKNLRKIYFPHYEEEPHVTQLALSQRCLKYISKICPNLKILDFGLLNVKASVLSELTKSSLNLESLRIAVNGTMNDNHFSKMFVSTKTLKSVHLFCRNSAKICTCLKDLPKNCMEELVICNCYAFRGSRKTQELFYTFIIDSPNFPKLRRISIHKVPHEISAWSYNSCAKSFISLDLHGCGILYNGQMVNLLALANLQELRFSHNFGETDEFLIAISKSCSKLVKVVLGDGGYHSMTEKGLSALALNLNLKHLEIHGVQNFNGKDLPKMHSLEYFRSACCGNIKEEYFAEMLLTAVADSRSFELSISYIDSSMVRRFPSFNGKLQETIRKIQEDRTNGFLALSMLTVQHIPEFQGDIREMRIWLDCQKNKVKV